MQSRSHLPFRKNCEGYFFDKVGNVLAQDSGRGYLLFPGGGIEESETPEQAIVRETEEETGATITNLVFLGTVKIVWEKEWAKTEKQKKRYEQYQGDEMYFFAGKITRFTESKENQEDAWKGEKLMPYSEILGAIEQQLQQSPDQRIYRQTQKQYLLQARSKKEILRP